MKKKFMGVLLSVFLMGFVAHANALEFNAGPHWDGVKDSTGWVKGFDRDSIPQVATGLCSGVFIKVQNGTKHVADLISPCLLGATSYDTDKESQNNVVGGFKLVDFMGVNGGIYYSPKAQVRDNWYDNFVYGFGITLLGFGENILK